MRLWVTRLHMYAGLLSFTAFVVYGVAGLFALLRPAPPDRLPNPAVTSIVSFEVPGDLSDRALADRIYDTLDLPLTGPIPDFALGRDSAGHLRLNFYTPNGVRRVTVLEDTGQLRIERERADLWRFVNGLHATTVRSPSPRFLVRAWAWYNEAAIWSLILLTVSGVYLWLASRPSHRPGWVALVLGNGVFLLLYWITRR